MFDNYMASLARAANPQYAAQMRNQAMLNEQRQYDQSQTAKRQKVFTDLIGNIATPGNINSSANPALNMQPIMQNPNDEAAPWIDNPEFIAAKKGKGLLGNEFDREGLFLRALGKAQTAEGFDLASKGFLNPGRNKGLASKQFLTGQDGRVMVGDRGTGGLEYAQMKGGGPAYMAQYDAPTRGRVTRAMENEKISPVTMGDGRVIPTRLGDVVNGKTNVNQNWKWEGKKPITQDQLNLVNHDQGGNQSSYGQTTRDLERAKADVAVEREADIQNDALKRQFTQLHDKLATPYNGQSIEDMIRGSTTSGFGSNVDSVGDYVGYADDKSINSATLNTLSGWLTSNVPRMEGPQGEKDVELYRKMAGDIASATSVEKRLSIYKNLVSLTKDMADKFSSGYYKRTNKDAKKVSNTDDRIAELEAKIAAKKAAQNDR